MRVRMLGSAAAAFGFAASIVCFSGVVAAFAGAPGPYISSTSPAAGSQVAMVTTTVAGNPNGRAVTFTMAADDPDGIMPASSGGATLTVTGAGVATQTLSPTIAYVAGSAETKAVL
jgi:hypothetical protein